MNFTERYNEIVAELDDMLSQERYEKIYEQIEQGTFDEWEAFWNEAGDEIEYVYSDCFAERMRNLLCLMIDVGAYTRVKELLEERIEFGFWASDECECVITHCVNTIDDEGTLLDLLKVIPKDSFLPNVLENVKPAVAAARANKLRVMDFLWYNENEAERYFCGEYTALQYAVLIGNVELARHALDKWGHGTEMTNWHDETPLMIAAITDNVAMASLLLKHGAEINVTGRQGKTPLDLARSEDMRTLLLSRGAQSSSYAQVLFWGLVDFVENYGFFGEGQLAELCSLEDVLIEYRDVNLAMLAATYGDVDALRTILSVYDAGQKINDLLVCAFQDKRTNRKVKDEKKTFNQVREMVTLFCAMGYRLGRPIRGRDNPFFQISNYAREILVADRSVSRELFDGLWELGCRLDVKSEGYHNTLYNAIYELNVPLLEYHLEKGVKFSEVDNANESVVDAVLKKSFFGHKDEFLDIQRALLERVLEEGYDINAINDNGETCIHRLVAFDRLSEKSLLLAMEFGADVSRKDKYGYTAYDEARAGGNSAVIELLKEHM